MRWMLLAVLTIECSSSEAERPTACRRADRTGTYRITYVNEGGDCGEAAPEIARYESGVYVPGANVKCAAANERWSNNDCTYESTVTCTTPESTSAGTGITRQDSQDGSQLSGTSTVEVRKLDGSLVCRGTYRLTATRQ